jgi:hypothetical protein
MPKLVCLSPIEHDGLPYAVGAELEVDQEQAEALLLVNAAQLIEAAPAAPVKPPRVKKDG